MFDYYNFEYKENSSLINDINNAAYDKQESGELIPYYWIITFDKIFQ